METANMLEPTPLDERKQQILKAVVSDYTVTGVPVGSQVLAAKYFIALSSATIRNELADLVGTGYVQQPHTSAGRIRTDRGYRYFVDLLMETEYASPGVRRARRSAGATWSRSRRTAPDHRTRVRVDRDSPGAAPDRGPA